MSNTITYRLAGVATAITGHNKYARQLQEYFKGARSDVKEVISINIHVCDSVKELSFSETPLFYAEGRGMQINRNGFIANSGRCLYRVDNLFIENEPVNIWLYYEERRGIRRFAKTVMTNIDPYMIGRECEEERFIADALSYSVLWWILALAFMKYDRVFVHSGMAMKSDMGVVLAGTGGCGKTSTISEMLNEGWKYIAEDFGVICADGTIWEIPKRGAISAEDVSYGSARLVKLINSLPAWQKLRWNYYKKRGKNPLISPSLEMLYGKENIAEKAKLWKTVCVSRCSNEGIVEKKVSVDDMAIRIVGASFRVIREMYNVMPNLHAVVDETCKKNFPSMSTIESRYREIITKALEHTGYCVLEIPLKANPKLIKEYILRDFPE